MGIEFEYRRITPEEFNASPSHPFGLDLVEDWDELISFYDDLRCSDDYLNIGKDWQAIHFLLTGEAAMDRSSAPPPLRNVVFGGTETEYESDFGKVRCLNSSEVKDTAEAIKQISSDELRSHFDANALNAARIYPNPQPGGWSLEELESVLSTYEQLKQFFQEAAKQDKLIFISPG